MRKKTFSDEQIALALRDAETGTPVTVSAGRWACPSNPFTGGRRSTLGWDRRTPPATQGWGEAHPVCLLSIPFINSH